MNSRIHPTAIIGSGVELANDVTVGPFAVIEGPSRIGAGSRIDAHAVIHRFVRMGRGNRVHPHAVLGGPPQDLGFDPDSETYLDIGDENIFREAVTISRATRPGGSTRLGSNNYLMNNCHLGHDCQLGDGNILASGATLGGHAHVGDKVFFGGGVMVHQFCRIGSFAILQGLAGINKDVIPYTLVAGRPGKHYRLNIVGLRRAGLDSASLKILSSAFRRLRLGQTLDDLESTAELEMLRAWLAAPSKRGGSLGFLKSEARGEE